MLYLCLDTGLSEAGEGGNLEDDRRPLEDHAAVEERPVRTGHFRPGDGLPGRRVSRVRRRGGPIPDDLRGSGFSGPALRFGCSAIFNITPHKSRHLRPDRRRHRWLSFSSRAGIKMSTWRMRSTLNRWWRHIRTFARWTSNVGTSSGIFDGLRWTVSASSTVGFSRCSSCRRTNDRISGIILPNSEPRQHGYFRWRWSTWPGADVASIVGSLRTRSSPVLRFEQFSAGIQLQSFDIFRIRSPNQRPQTIPTVGVKSGILRRISTEIFFSRAWIEMHSIVIDVRMRFACIYFIFFSNYIIYNYIVFGSIPLYINVNKVKSENKSIVF